MDVEPRSSIERLAEFVAAATVPDEALAAAAWAVHDTVGVTLAGASEEAACIVQSLAREESPIGPARVFGTDLVTSPAWAALANGTAAHALDFDDMCWVSMAHPSAPLVAAGLAAAEMAATTGRAVLEGYVVGFEVAAALGRVMNPSHYENGWHATSTIGTVAAAATTARILGFDPERCLRTLAIAASEASGVKANFGTMVKPIQVGLAGRNGVLAAQLAARGATAAESAIDGPQGLMVAMRGSGRDLTEVASRLGSRWEIVDGGITTKLYPSCAATHPTIDTLLDLRREIGFEPPDVSAVEIAVDAVTPTVLVYDSPTTGLEGKFSLHYCAAAALAHGRVDIATFESESVTDPTTRGLVERVHMRVDDRLGVDAPPLTQARLTLRLTDGRSFERAADGARGYPDRPPRPADRREKFLGCAARTLSRSAAETVCDRLESLGEVDAIAEVTAALVPTPIAAPSHTPVAR